MSAVAAAVIGGTLISAGTGIYAANKSAKAQKDAAGNAIDTQQAMFEQTQKTLAPWVEAGKWALGSSASGEGVLQSDAQNRGVVPEEYFQMHPELREAAKEWSRLTGRPESLYPASHYVNFGQPAGYYPNPAAKQYAEGGGGTDNYLAQGQPQQGTGLIGMIEQGPGEFVPEEQPGYKFGYQEFVENPTLRSAAATGGLGSGATQKALTRYASDYASTGYDNWLNRYYQTLEPRFRLAGLGQASAAQQAALGQNTAGNIGNAQLAQGQAGSDKYINYGNTISGGISSALDNWLALRGLQGGGGLFGTAGNSSPYRSGGYNRYDLNMINK